MSVATLAAEFDRLSTEEQRQFLETISRSVDQTTRLEMVHFWIDSLAGNDYGVSDEDAAELERRFHDAESGQVELLDGETVLRETAERYGFKI